MKPHHRRRTYRMIAYPCGVRNHMPMPENPDGAHVIHAMRLKDLAKNKGVVIEAEYDESSMETLIIRAYPEIKPEMFDCASYTEEIQRTFLQ